MDNQEKPEKPPPGVLFEDLVQYANQYTGGAHPSDRDWETGLHSRPTINNRS